MTIDLTDWAALLEALDGIIGTPPSPPPLPVGCDGMIAPFMVSFSNRRSSGQRPARSMSRSQ